MDSLDRAYAKSTLLTVYFKGGKVKKSDLKGTVSNWRTISDVLGDLASDGYLTVNEEIIGRRTYLISLTDKGTRVAEQLKRAEEAAKGVVINEQEGRAEIPAETAEEWAKKFREVTKGMSLLYHVNVYEDHVTIGQEIAGKKHVINVYTKVNGKGLLQLWCEEDESFDCVHVTYAWTIPKVREMFQNAVRDGRVNGK